MALHRTNRWINRLRTSLTFLSTGVLNSILRFFTHPVLALSAGRQLIEPADNHVVLANLPRRKLTAGYGALHFLIGVITWPFFAALAVAKFVFMGIPLIALSLFTACTLAVTSIMDSIETRKKHLDQPKGDSPKKKQEEKKSTTVISSELAKLVVSSDHNAQAAAAKKDDEDKKEDEVVTHESSKKDLNIAPTDELPGAAEIDEADASETSTSKSCR